MKKIKMLNDFKSTDGEVWIKVIKEFIEKHENKPMDSMYRPLGYYICSWHMQRIFETLSTPQINYRLKKASKLGFGEIITSVYCTELYIPVEMIN